MYNPATPGMPQHPEDCVRLRELLARLGEKWTMALLRMLGGQRLRFKELHRAIAGISERMLAVTLRNLERDGLIVRMNYPEVPARVEYEVSPLGRSLAEALESLAHWAAEHQVMIESARRQYDLKEKAAAGVQGRQPAGP